MRYPKKTGTGLERLACAIAAAAIVLSMTGQSPLAPAAASAARRACRRVVTFDSVCRETGAVWEKERLLALRRVIPVQAPATLTAAAGALGWVAFANQARCQLGLSGNPSEIETRPEPSALFRQISGRTRCEVFRAPTNAEFLCNFTGPCPAVLTVEGEFIARNLTGDAARISAAESLRQVHIVLCAGSARVRVENEHATAEAAGGASGSNEFIIDLIESATGDIFLQTESVYVAGGPCHRPLR